MPGLPESGTRVEAVTLPSDEYDRGAEKLVGVLHTRPSPFGPPPNCYVNGIGVDPATVKQVGQYPEVERHAFDPAQPRDDIGRWTGVGGGNPLSEKANAATTKANALSAAAATPEDHLKAAKAHRRAADEHYDATDTIGTLAVKATARPGDVEAQAYFERMLAIAHEHQAYMEYHQGHAERHKVARRAPPPAEKPGGVEKHVTDASGYEHKPAGTPEGGQFVGGTPRQKALKKLGRLANWRDQAEAALKEDPSDEEMRANFAEYSRLVEEAGAEYKRLSAEEDEAEQSPKAAKSPLVARFERQLAEAEALLKEDFPQWTADPSKVPEGPLGKGYRDRVKLIEEARANLDKARAAAGR